MALSEAEQLKKVRSWHSKSDVITEIKNPSEAVKLAAVNRHGDAIQYIENPSEDVKLAAVKQNGDVIRHIENPSEAVKLAAVNRHGDVIRHIENPSEDVKIAAVKQCVDALQRIENPSEAVKLAAVKQNGTALQYIENPSEAVKLAAVKQDGTAIRCIESLSEDVKLAAVKQNGYAIQHIRNPPEAIKLAAIKQNYNALQRIRKENRTDELEQAALKKSGLAIRYFRNPTFEDCRVAVKKSVGALQFMDHFEEEGRITEDQLVELCKLVKNPLKYIRNEKIKPRLGKSMTVEEGASDLARAVGNKLLSEYGLATEILGSTKHYGQFTGKFTRMTLDYGPVHFKVEAYEKGTIALVQWPRSLSGDQSQKILDLCFALSHRSGTSFKIDNIKTKAVLEIGASTEILSDPECEFPVVIDLVCQWLGSVNK